MTATLGGRESSERHVTSPTGAPVGSLAPSEAFAPARLLLTVSLRTFGSTSVLALSGELTATTVGALEAQIEQLAVTPSSDVVLDVLHLRTLDDVGARVLIGLYHYARGKGQRMTMFGASPIIVGRLAGSPLAEDPAS